MTANAYNTIDKIKYHTDFLDIRYASKDPHAAEQTVDPKFDMAGIITQLTHLVLASRCQFIKMEQYIRKIKEWLTGYDWKKVRLKLRFVIRTLLKVRYRLKPTYPEGDLVRVVELFWLNDYYDMPITEMDHRIDQVSDKIIKEYEDDGHLVDIDSDDQNLLKNMTRNISTSQIKGEWSTVQRVAILTFMITTGDEPAISM